MICLAEKRNGYINKQIAVSKTAKRIIETIGSLKLAGIENAEKIHAWSEESGNGRRVYSRIKLNLINIEGRQNQSLEFNLTPNEVLWLLYRARLGVIYRQNYSDTLYRRWPGKDGTVVEPSVTVRYVKAMRYPFQIELKRLEGIPDESGGIIDIKIEKMINMLLSDQGFFTLLSDTARYIKLWEFTFGCKLIKERHVKDEFFAASQAISLRLRQISVRKTESTIIECLDSLKPANVEYAENIYAGERYYADDDFTESEESKPLVRDHSRITLKIRDIKNRTIDGKQGTAGFALSASDINYLIAVIEPSLLFKKDFEFSGFRKWGVNGGQITHSMLYMQYQRFTDDSMKEEYNYPYYINITNRAGKGDKLGNKIVHKESETQFSVRLSPFEFFSLIMDCKRYMDVFEAAYGVRVIADKSALEKRMREQYFSQAEWGSYNAM